VFAGGRWQSPLALAVAGVFSESSSSQFSISQYGIFSRGSMFFDASFFFFFFFFFSSYNSAQIGV
jgi:hypothetical protein